jgi:hypothetical protein
MRQRVRTQGSPLRLVGRLLVLLLAGALIWYGLMTVLVAAKIVSAGTADELSGYRTAFEWLSAIQPTDISGGERALIGLAGLLAFLVFGWLALKELPRPYLARGELELGGDERGIVQVEPRAVERLAEIAAQRNPAVAGASGRFGGEDLAVNVTVRRAREVADTLRDVQARVRRALDEHGLPQMPVDVTLAGYDRKQRRELR